MATRGPPCFLQGARKFAVILAFDVPVNREARELAESMGVRIFTADIIYHLFDQFTAYLKQARMLCMLTVAALDASLVCAVELCGTIRSRRHAEGRPNAA